MVDHGALQHSKNGLLAETQLHPLLSLSVQRLDLENMNRLLNLGISPTKADFADNSLLHLLFEVFDSEPHLAALIATKLLFYGIDPNKPNATNWAPLHVAALGCQVEAIKWAI
jgi:ankyrin repeat protein